VKSVADSDTRLSWALRYLSDIKQVLLGVNEIDSLSKLTFLPDFGYIFIDDDGAHFCVIYVDDVWTVYRFNSDVPEEANGDKLISDSKDPEFAWNMFCVDKAPGYSYFFRFLPLIARVHPPRVSPWVLARC
jgi:hypothetical protein